jgi:2-polyprenyl-3-methyl-5-hydroxy-6-metoxy-1,4-benzoquinol methylase
VDTDELTALLQEVSDRVRARHPEAGAAAAVPLPDLMPLLHARDAAEAKVASIGTVNPRSGGPLNWLAQQVKKAIARALDWHVREQVEFNRHVMACVQATLESLEETRRSMALLGDELHHLRSYVGSEVQELKDIRGHWAEWRQGWEHKLVVNETKLLRGLAELNSAFQHRAGLTESTFRDQVKAQHADFTAALERSLKQLWANLETVRLEYEGLIHAELRVIRQRAAVAATVPPAPGSGAGSQPAAASQAALPAFNNLRRGFDHASPQTQSPPLAFDYGRFAERFRGPEEYVQNGQRFYLPYFTGRHAVLDIGCGRGEFLALMRDEGIAARGIDLSQESVGLCRHKGLQAETADLFAYLVSLPEASLDGIFSSQVVEHLPPESLPEMIRLAASRLERGGVLAIETPNPECLAIFASHFYLDPTHTRPVPHGLLVFYMEECGLGGIQVHRLSPAIESMPALASLPNDFREAFFGGLDYAIIAKKL